MEKLPIGILTLLVTTLVWGAFLVPSAYAVDLDNANALDYIDSTADSFYYFGDTNETLDVAGWAYKPSASHNVCSITAVLGGSTYNVDALQLDIRSVNATSTLSSSGNLTTKGTLLQTSTHLQVRNGVLQEKTFNFSPCVTVVGANSYLLLMYRDGAASTTARYWVQVGVTKTSGSDTLSTAYYNGTAYYNDNNSWFDITINGTQNFGAFMASSTTSYSVNTCTPPTSIFDVGGGVSYAFCQMFVPNQAVLDQFNTLDDFLLTREPFVSASEFVSAYNNIVIGTASTSPTTTIDFSSMTCTGTAGGCDPEIKEWLPTEFTIFATSSLGTFVTPTAIDYVRWMMVIGIWFGVGLYFYRRGINILRPTT